MQEKIGSNGAERVRLYRSLLTLYLRAFEWHVLTYSSYRYVAAPRFRAGMAALWQMPELNDWWLPNNEGYPNIVREVRAFTEERTRNPQDDFRESVRDMKTLFWKINLDDTESEKSSPSTLGGGP